MKIVKCANQLEKTKKKVVSINLFYKGDYIYRVGIVENENIIEVKKEDTKSEYFEIEYFEIKN